MRKFSKRLVSAVTALTLIGSTAGITNISDNSTVSDVSAASSSYNYVEALQKSMFFYEVQQAGILPEWNDVLWRDNSMVKEDGTPSDVVDGGWFDAGDHFKFTLTNAYSASMLGWGYIEYKDAVDKAGLGTMYKNNLKWGLDYVMACDKGGGAMIGTIGDFKSGATDHNIWCSAEVYMRKHHLVAGNEERPYDTIKNASVAAISAAALAEGYIIFKDSDPDTAANYLKHAKDLFEGADKIRDNKDVGGMSGMYNTSSWLDDCMYAANWLFRATGDTSYIDKIKKDYIPDFPTESQSTDKKYTWGLCWDDTSQAAALLYAQNTGDKEWIDHVSHHLDYWIDGYGGKKVDYTPDGMAWLTNWGSARHVSSTAWLAKLASDTIFSDNSSLQSKYNDWAKKQMDYIFGDNGLKMSYVLGMGDKQPSAFHHRTASGIHDDHWNELGTSGSTTSMGSDEEWQTEYAHTLYGALVGGPDMSGNYKNSVAQYEYSEVAIDYNAGYTACLCAMADDFGGEKEADFPPTETPKWAEWEVAAMLNGSGQSYTELKAWAMNHTAWPARVEKDIAYRYFFDASEVFAAGLTVDDIKVEAKSQQYNSGEQGFATVSGPHKFEGDPSGNTYYAEIKFEDGRAIQPTGQSEHRDEVQFRISIPDEKAANGAWDSSNDWSFEGVDKATSLKKSSSLNEHITMYVNGVLVWGEEPDGTKPVYTPPAKRSGVSTGDSSGHEAVVTTATTVTEPKITTTETTKENTNVTTNGQNPTGGTDAQIIYGDLNGDKNADLTDLTILSVYLMTKDKSKVKVFAAADVDGDGSVDIADLPRFKQYISKDSSVSYLGPKH